VPERLIERLEAATDRQAESVEIATEIILAVKPLCQGVHLMAMGWEHLLPQILGAACKSGEG
jgi:5,10-methylenetetrahydrofolate reductase